jgi:hypothetical protein
VRFAYFLTRNCTERPAAMTVAPLDRRCTGAT